MKQILKSNICHMPDSVVNMVNEHSEQLLFAGFKVTASTITGLDIANEWYRIDIRRKRYSQTTVASVYHRNKLIIREWSIGEAIRALLQVVHYGTHYVYVAGLAICPLQKFGDFNTEHKLIGLFNKLCDGRAELQYKSDKAFRWVMSNGAELTIKQSSSIDETIEEETTMDIFSLVAASELFNVEVKFPNSAQLYSYKSEVEYAEGDTIVVDTPSNGLVVVTVVGCTKGLTGGNFPKYKWVVAKVDRSRYDELVTNEATAIKHIEAAKRADTVRKELEALGVSQAEVLQMLGLASKADSQ